MRRAAATMFCGQRSAQPFNFQVLMPITRLAVLEEEEEGGGASIYRYFAEF